MRKPDPRRLRGERPAPSLWAMRHGETEWNVRGLLQGHGDAPLTERGERQVEEAARLLAGEGITRVVSSDLGRALRTAAVVAGRLGVPALADPRWRELDVGSALEGTPASELPRAPGYERRADWRCPGGESLLAVRSRVLGALAELVRDPRPTLVVTHGGPLRILLAEARGVAPEGILDVHLPRSFVGRFDLAAGRLRPPILLRG